MSWANAFSGFVSGFQQGYGFVENIRNAQSARAYEAARTQALETEYSPENIALERRATEARIADAEAMAAQRRYEVETGPERFDLQRRETESQIKSRGVNDLYNQTQMTGMQLDNAKKQYNQNIRNSNLESQQQKLQSMGFGDTGVGLDQKPTQAIPTDTAPAANGALPYSTTRGGGVTTGVSGIAATDLEPHVVALLNTIAKDESGGSYNIRYGGPGGAKRFELNGQHPGIFEPTLDGKDQSSAAGRYQFTKTTWDDITKGQVPFTPENQDRMAWALAQRDYKARTGQDLDTVLRNEGMTSDVVKALAPTWEAFKKNSADRYVSAYQQEVGRLGTALEATEAMASGDPKLQAALAAGLPVGEEGVSSYDAARGAPSPAIPKMEQLGHEGVLMAMDTALTELMGAEPAPGIPTQELEAGQARWVMGDEENAADPDDVDKLDAELAKAGGKTYKRMTTAQQNIARYALIMQTAQQTGEWDEARHAAAALLQYNKIAMNNHLAIAKAALEDGEIKPAIKALISAHANIPDGVDITIEPLKNGDISIKKYDSAKNMIGEEVLMDPETFTTTILETTPAFFEQSIAQAAGEREALTSPKVASALQNIHGEKFPNMAGEPMRDTQLLANEFSAVGTRGRGGGGAGGGDSQQKVSDLLAVAEPAAEALGAILPMVGIEPPNVVNGRQIAGNITPEQYQAMQSATQELIVDARMVPDKAAMVVASLSRYTDEYQQFTEVPNMEKGTVTYTILAPDGSPRTEPLEIPMSVAQNLRVIRGAAFKKLQDEKKAAMEPTMGDRIGSAVGGAIGSIFGTSQAAQPSAIPTAPVGPYRDQRPALPPAGLAIPRRPYGDQSGIAY